MCNRVHYIRSWCFKTVFYCGTFCQGVGTAGPYAVCLSPVGPKMALNSAELLPEREKEQQLVSYFHEDGGKEAEFMGEAVGGFLGACLLITVKPPFFKSLCATVLINNSENKM